MAAVSPAEPVLNENPSAIALTLKNPPANLTALTCYGPTGDLLDIAIDETQVCITPNQRFPTGRTLINCTLPSTEPASSGAWYWFGWQMIADFETEGISVHARYH